MISTALQAQLQDLGTAVANARAAVAAGAAVDFTGLDEAVARACAAAAELPKPERAAAADAMAALIRELDQLRDALQRQDAALERRRAAQAYGGEHQR